MTEENSGLGLSEGLRKRAEERVGLDRACSQATLPPEQVQRALHDLHVHQVELEMQNEELRRTQEELLASRERYFELYDLAPVGYITLGESGLILNANLTAAKLLNAARADLIEQPLQQFILPDDQDIYYRQRKQLFEPGSPHAFELRLVKKDGPPFWARFEVIVAAAGDRTLRFHAVVIDITERKRAVEALEQAKEAAEAANRAKDQFIAVLSHELRTPLTPVLAAVSALEARADLPEKLRSKMELIERNVEMEVALIDDLLDVTRIRQGKIELQPEVVDIHACLASVLEICRVEIGSKRLDLRLEFNAGQHHVWADAARLRQVFWNLVRNAVKFTPSGGCITLRTRNAGDRLQIDVVDTGIGIEPDAMPRIFNPFEQGERSKTRQFGGLGLGLNIARSVVELHHGRLTAFSEGKDQGATFTVELLTAPPVTEPARATRTVEPDLRPLRVLLVEDHFDTAQVLSNLLRKWGHSVTVADSVHNALELAAKQKFDLLVSDLGLPDGSGLDIMHELKRRTAIPGIALSGYGTEEDIRESRDAGFNEHLTKPVNAQVLRSAMQRSVPKAA